MKVALCSLLLLICILQPASASVAGVSGWGCSGTLRMGLYTRTDATDSLDGYDLQSGPISGWLAGSYRISGQDGWTGVTGFYSRDVRAPLLPGETKTWMVYVWAVPGSSAQDFGSEWGWAVSSRDQSVEAKLEYIQKPSGVIGGPSLGTIWTTPPTTLILPYYSTSNGLTGYGFRYTLTAVPEPSSLIALGALVAPLFALRRHRRY